MGMCGVPPLILKHLISSVVSQAQLVSPSVALPAELVMFFVALEICFFLSFDFYYNWGKTVFNHLKKKRLGGSPRLNPLEIQNFEN